MTVSFSIHFVSYFDIWLTSGRLYKWALQGGWTFIFNLMCELNNSKITYQFPKLYEIYNSSTILDKINIPIPRYFRNKYLLRITQIIQSWLYFSGGLVCYSHITYQLVFFRPRAQSDEVHRHHSRVVFLNEYIFLFR